MNSATYVDEICIEKHKHIEQKLKEHEKRLDGHSKRIDDLCEDGREYKVQIQNLCRQIEDLTKTIKWFMGLLGGSFVGFFFYAVQQGIFK
ncbi:hemolysin XhlA family protein [Tepidibacter hydrothermalis]|uniref:Hemolysin XhlA family protein n=1 Tax=Tepidibacter hydrothermalis TaxID=3036126 RepID=A0ABY8EHL6_9FIRM|nr:hemolysin XhlA family protein [Tepidibacter hydrothermalis]WFD12443.1 hemolysin XhlA family protein [Tepidibacter hydrothermalis]